MPEMNDRPSMFCVPQCLLPSISVSMHPILRVSEISPVSVVDFRETFAIVACWNGDELIYATADEADAYMFYRCFFLFFVFFSSVKKIPDNRSRERLNRFS